MSRWSRSSLGLVDQLCYFPKFCHRTFSSWFEYGLLWIVPLLRNLRGFYNPFNFTWLHFPKFPWTLFTSQFFLLHVHTVCLKYSLYHRQAPFILLFYGFVWNINTISHTKSFINKMLNALSCVKSSQRCFISSLKELKENFHLTLKIDWRTYE